MWAAKASGKRLAIVLDLYGVVLRVPVKNELVVASDYIDDFQTSIRDVTRNYNVYTITYCSEPDEKQLRAHLHSIDLDKYIPESNWVFIRHRHAKISTCQVAQFDVLVDDSAALVEYYNKQADKKRLKVIHFENWKSLKF
jgi:hypothetical protein